VKRDKKFSEKRFVVALQRTLRPLAQQRTNFNFSETILSIAANEEET